MFFVFDFRLTAFCLIQLNKLAEWRLDLLDIHDQQKSEQTQPSRTSKLTKH